MPIPLQRNTQNRIMYTYTDAGNFTYFSYDNHGNVEWMVQQTPGLGKNYIKYTYDLASGNVKKISYNEGRVDQFYHK